MVKAMGRKDLERTFTAPVINLIARTGITPNALTWIGFLITVVAAVLIMTGHLFAGAWVMLGAGVFDMLDGSLARALNRTSKFGGILDSTLDRLSEAVILLGIAIFYARAGSVGAAGLAGAALVGSYMVSYIRARAEGAGLECLVGFFTRTERVIVLALGLLLNQLFPALFIALVIITLLSFATAGQRLYHVWQKTK